MQSKKTYCEYKNSSAVKFPTIQWVLDRSIIYIALLLVAVIAIGFFVKSGLDSYNSVVQEPVIITPYLDIQPASSIGKSWAQEVIALNPDTPEAWTVLEVTKPQSPIDAKLCPQISDITTSLLTTHLASGPKTQTRVQVYGAGQAASQFASYVKKLETCFGPLTSEKISESTIAKFGTSFILTAGDAIIGVNTVNDSARDNLVNFYLSQVEETLKNTGCVSLNVAEGAAKRSFFYDQNSYTGLEEGKPLETEVNIRELPTPVGLETKQVVNPESTVPEAPLPLGFPELPKDQISEPVLPAPIKDEPGFAGNAVYRIFDEKGPGCGWDWSAQIPPVLDVKKLESDKKEAINVLQTDLNNKATEYVSSKINWSLQIAAIAPTVDQWNSHINQINAVHDKWAWLKNERAKIQTPWYSYVEAHDFWITFDSRKSTAIKKYEEEYKKCEADKKALADWEKEWKDRYDKREADKNKPTATATATPEAKTTPTAIATEKEEIPEKPKGCEAEPVKELIVDQEKPLEPMPPVIPEGVTIPASWPVIKTS